MAENANNEFQFRSSVMTSATLDLIVVPVTGFLVWLVFGQTEASDRFFPWVAENASNKGHAIIPVFMLLPICGAIFASRRSCQMLLANAQLQVAELPFIITTQKE